MSIFCNCSVIKSTSRNFFEPSKSQAVNKYLHYWNIATFLIFKLLTFSKTALQIHRQQNNEWHALWILTSVTFTSFFVGNEWYNNPVLLRLCMPFDWYHSISRWHFTLNSSNSCRYLYIECWYLYVGMLFEPTQTYYLTMLSWLKKPINCPLEIHFTLKSFLYIKV